MGAFLGERAGRSVARAAEAERGPAADELAWLLLGPAVLIAALVVALLAKPLGQVAFRPAPFHYWAPELVVRKATVQAGYMLMVVCVAAYALTIVRVRGWRQLAPPWRRGVVVATQATLVAFLAFAWIEQRNVRTGGTTRIFFTLPTVLVAAVLAALLAAWIRRGLALPRRLRAAVARGASSRAVAGACLAVAIALTAVWLLPAVSTDRNFALAPGDVTFLDRFFFDEATSLLNGRSPLANMAAYGTIWPYVTALPLRAFGGSYLGFSLLMAAVSGTALLAVYGVLRRVTGSALAALALYLPLLATSLFVIVRTPVRGLGEVRYYPANYFGVWPLRYAGPYLLAWLTVRWIDRARPRELATALLFMAAGLVMLNNIDFGVAAFGGTLAAAVCTLHPLDRAQLLRLGRSVAIGLVGATVLASAFTLVRAGSLPSLDLLTVYGRTFASGGFGNLPLPAFGFHLVMTATFVAALAAAAVRTRVRAPERALTGMLAWSGIFGLGASIYFYAYRSHQFSIMHLFSAWALAVVLLVVAIARAHRERLRWPALPELAVLVAFGLLVCSLAQVPRPWQDVRRLERRVATQPLRNPAEAAAIASESAPGERVAILDAIGHRVAREANVVDVAPFTGLEQMGTSEQMGEVLDMLEREGGRRVFILTSAPVPSSVLNGAIAVLESRGYYLAKRWPNLVEYVANRP